MAHQPRGADIGHCTNVIPAKSDQKYPNVVLTWHQPTTVLTPNTSNQFRTLFKGGIVLGNPHTTLLYCMYQGGDHVYLLIREQPIMPRHSAEGSKAPHH